MSFIVTSRTRSSGPVEVNWNNPITRDLVVAFSPRYRGGFVNAAVTQNAWSHANGTVKTAHSDRGLAYKFEGAGFLYTNTQVEPAGTDYGYTFFSTLLPTATGEVFGWSQEDGTVYVLLRFSTSTGYSFQYRNSGSTYSASDPSGHRGAVWSNVGATYRLIAGGSSGASALYVDGSLRGTASSSFDNPGAAGMNYMTFGGLVYVFARLADGGGSRITAHVLNGFGWKRALSADEHMAMSADNSQIWRRFKSQTFYSLSGGGGSPTANRIMLMRRPGLSRVWR